MSGGRWGQLPDPTPDPTSETEADLETDHQCDGGDGPTRRHALALGATAALAGGALTVAGGAEAAAATKPLIKLSAIKVGRSVRAGNLIVTRVTARTAVARSAVCMHQGCLVAVSGSKLACPCHGSQFNPRTGAVLAGPASRPLPAIRLRIRKGYLYRA